MSLFRAKNMFHKILLRDITFKHLLSQNFTIYDSHYQIISFFVISSSDNEATKKVFRPHKDKWISCQSLIYDQANHDFFLQNYDSIMLFLEELEVEEKKTTSGLSKLLNSWRRNW